VFNAVLQPEPPEEARRAPSESRAFLWCDIEFQLGHVSGTTVTGANFMAPPSLPRVRAYSLNTLAVSPPLVSEILSAPGNVRINGKILKRQRCEYFGSSNTVFNAALQPEPPEEARRAPSESRAF